MHIKFSFPDGRVITFHVASLAASTIYDLVKKYFNIISVNDKTLTELFTGQADSPSRGTREMRCDR